MKTKILTLSFYFFIAGILLTSCADNAKQDSKELQRDIEDTHREIERSAEDIRAQTRQEWEEFKTSSNEVFENREREIKSLREEILKADKQKRVRLNKELDELEQKNRTLKERIATRTNSVKDDFSDLNEKAIEDHKIAERELKHDMDELGKSIGDFFKRNRTN